MKAWLVALALVGGCKPWGVGDDPAVAELRRELAILRHEWTHERRPECSRCHEPAALPDREAWR